MEMVNAVSDLATRIYAETGMAPKLLILPGRDFDRLLAEVEGSLRFAFPYLPGMVPPTDSLKIIHLGGILEVRRERPVVSTTVELTAESATPSERTATARERFIFDAEADGARLVFNFGNGYRPVPTANYIDEWTDVETNPGLGPCLEP